MTTWHEYEEQQAEIERREEREQQVERFATFEMQGVDHKIKLDSGGFSGGSWHETYDNVIGLFLWLERYCFPDWPADEALSAMQKPWKYGREYEIWRLWQELPTGSANAAICIDAIEGKTTADELRKELGL